MARTRLDDVREDLRVIATKIDKLTDAVSGQQTALALLKNDLNDHLHNHKLDVDARIASRNALYRNITILVATAQVLFEVAKWLLSGRL